MRLRFSPREEVLTNDPHDLTSFLVQVVRLVILKKNELHVH